MVLRAFSFGRVSSGEVNRVVVVGGHRVHLSETYFGTWLFDDFGGTGDYYSLLIDL